MQLLESKEATVKTPVIFALDIQLFGVYNFIFSLNLCELKSHLVGGFNPFEKY